MRAGANDAGHKGPGLSSLGTSDWRGGRSELACVRGSGNWAASWAEPLGIEHGGGGELAGPNYSR